MQNLDNDTIASAYLTGDTAVKSQWLGCFWWCSCACSCGLLLHHWKSVLFPLNDGTWKKWREVYVRHLKTNTVLYFDIALNINIILKWPQESARCRFWHFWFHCIQRFLQIWLHYLISLHFFTFLQRRQIQERECPC